jgi:hypothetical protein
MKIRLIATLGVVGLVAAVPSLPASAAKPKPPKPFTKSYSVTDMTPDPTGNTNSNEAMHCKGKLPMEAPIKVKVPGPGDVDVTTAVTGDWSLMITDANGDVLGGADVNPPASEEASVRLKKAQTIDVYACNMEGAPSAKVTVHYAYRAPR